MTHDTNTATDALDPFEIASGEMLAHVRNHMLRLRELPLEDRYDALVAEPTGYADYWTEVAQAQRARPVAPLTHEDAAGIEALGARFLEQKNLFGHRRMVAEHNAQVAKVAALYQRLGYHTIAGIKGRKSPPSLGWNERLTPDLEAVYHNFTTYTWNPEVSKKIKRSKDRDRSKDKELRLSDPVNVCLLTGQGYADVVFDIDGPKGLQTLREAEAMYGKLPIGPKLLSGSGKGIHLPFRINLKDVPEGVTLHQGQGSFFKEGGGLDTRLGGGQIVVYPSVHPSGGMYRAAPGRALWQMQTDDLPKPWVDALIEFSIATQREIAAKQGTPLRPSPAQRKKTAERRKAERFENDVFARTATEMGGSRALYASDDDDDDGLPGGWENRVAQVGYGEGTANGCHAPIFTAALSFFSQFGTAEPVERLEAAIQARLVEVDKQRPGKLLEYWGQVAQEIENARQALIAEGVPEFKPRLYASFDALMAATKPRAEGGEVDDGDVLAAERVAMNAGTMPNLSPGQMQKVREALCPKGREKHRIGLDRSAFKKAFEEGGKYRWDDDGEDAGDDGEGDEAGLPENFVIEGAWIGVERKGEDTTHFVPVCRKFRNVGFLSDETGHGLGHLLEFVDEKGVTREIAYEHAETVRDSGAFLGRLAKNNMRFKGGEDARRLTCVLFADMPNGDPILNVSKPGFHNYTNDMTVYVPILGDVVALKKDRQSIKVRLQDGVRLSVPGTKGTLDGWLNRARGVMRVCDFHSTMIFGAGFAGPVLSLLGSPSCGLNFTGAPGSGKSLGCKSAAAIFGPVLGGRGLWISADASGTGGELSAVRANGATYYLDELSRMDPRLRQRVIMMLAEGTGKVRGQADVTLRNTTSWAFYFVTNGEVELDQMIEEGGVTKAGGIDRRMPEFDCTGAKVWNDLEQVKELEESVDEDYGHAGAAFVQYLFDEGYVGNEGRERLRQMVADKAKLLLGEGGEKRPGAVQSAAYVVSIAYVAALLAKDAALFPAVDGRDIDADFMTGWRDRCKLGEEGGDTSASAVKAISGFWGKLDSLWTVHGVDLDDPLNAPQHREHLFYKGAELRHTDGKPYVVIRADAIDKLYPAAIKRAAMLRELNVIKHGRNAKWDTLPKQCGGKPGPHYRITLPDGWYTGASADDPMQKAADDMAAGGERRRRF